MNRTYRYETISVADLPPDLNAEAIDGQATEAVEITIYDETGTVAEAEVAQALYLPEIGRMGISWGADATWANVDDLESGIEMWLNDGEEWEAIEINHDLRRWQIVHFDERRSAHYVTDIAPTYGTGTDEHEANAHLIVEAVNGYAALQERLEAAERLNGELVEALRAIISESERPYVGSGFLDWVHSTATDALDRIDARKGK